MNSIYLQITDLYDIADQDKYSLTENELMNCVIITRLNLSNNHMRLD